MAHVVLKNVERDVSDRFDNFPVSQADRSGACEVRVGQFPALYDDAARELQDGVGPRVGRCCANRVVNFGLIQPDLRRYGRVLTQAVAAQVAFGNRQR